MTSRRVTLASLVSMLLLGGMARGEDRLVRPARTDDYGDPLPPGALARLGTVRLRHGSGIYNLAFSPDGKTLAAGDFYTILFWDTATGKEVQRLSGQFFGVDAVAFSPDGKFLFSGSSDHAVRLWEVASGKVRLRRQEAAAVTSGTFSPDGKVLASGNHDGVIVLWSVLTGKELRRFQAHEIAIRSLAFSSDGKVLASGGADRLVCLWDMTTGKELHRLRGHGGGWVKQVTFSPDGRSLISQSEDDTARVWDTATGKEKHQFSRPSRSVEAVTFLRGGKALAVTGPDCYQKYTGLHLWGMEMGKKIRSFPFSQGWGPTQVALSADGRMVAAAWGDVIRIWDTATGKEPLPPEANLDPGEGVAFSPDGRHLVSGGTTAVLLWDLPGQTLKHALPTGSGVSRVVFSPDGKIIASVAVLGASVRLWDTTTGKQLRTLPKSTSYHELDALAFSPDGKSLAVTTSDQTIGLWDVATGKERWRQKEKLGRLARLAFSAGGETLLSSAGAAHQLQFRDSATGRVRRQLPLPPSRCLAFSPDRKLMALDEQRPGDCRLTLVDAASGEEIRLLATATKPFGHASFSPDGRILAGEFGKDVVLWEVVTGRQIGRFKHRYGTSEIAFSPDTRVLASAGRHSVLLWDLTGLMGDGAFPTISLLPGDLEALWEDLAGEDAATAQRAVWKLVAGSGKSVAFLRERLRPVLVSVPPSTTRWVNELDSPRLSVRQNAAEQLMRLGHHAQPALLQALQGRPTLEMRQRIERLLRELVREEKKCWRDLRALQVLEQVGMPEARKVLMALAGGEPNSRLTQETRAALQRLAKRP